MPTPARYIGLLPGNTAAQNTAAWNSFITGLGAAETVPLQFDQGTYDFSAQLDVIRPVQILGAGGGPWAARTVFRFPAGSHGVFFHSYTSYSGSPSTNRAQGARISDIRFQTLGMSTVRHAIYAREAVQIERCGIDAGWSGNGIHVFGDLASSIPSSPSLSVINNIAVGGVGRVTVVSSISRTSNVVTVVTATAHNFEGGADSPIWWLNNTSEDYCLPTVSVDGFALGNRGTELTIDSSTQFHFMEAGTDGTSTSGWEIRTGCGAYFHGGDANACITQMISSSAPKVAGIYEDSFLGNTFVACHVDQAGLYGFYSDKANGNAVFLGCYSEQNCPCDYVNAPAVAWGGTMAATQLGNALRAKSGMVNALKASVLNSAGQLLGQVGVGTQPNSFPHWLQILKDGDSQDYGLQLFHDYYPALQGAWDNWYSLSTYSGSTAFMLSTQGATSRKGHTVNPASFAFHAGYYDNMGCWCDAGTAVPSAGAWKVGDWRRNSSPAVGQPIGWFCTVAGDFAGTPPTFVAGPNL